MLHIFLAPTPPRPPIQADICQLGNDQRKVNMLAREYCDLTKRKLKPIIVSHAMLPGLKEGQEKMSKSDPDSAIFMEDSAADVKTKIKRAFCPPGVVANNPCLEYVRSIVLPWCGKLEVTRPEDNGGNVYVPLPRSCSSLCIRPVAASRTLVSYCFVYCFVVQLSCFVRVGIRRGMLYCSRFPQAVTALVIIAGGQGRARERAPGSVLAFSPRPPCGCLSCACMFRSVVLFPIFQVASVV